MPYEETDYGAKVYDFVEHCWREVDLADVYDNEVINSAE